MNVITSLVRPFLLRPWRASQATATPAGVEAAQRRVLDHLLSRGRRTSYGDRYDFGSLTGYEAFCRRVPVVQYEDIRADVEQMIGGAPDILWPGRTMRYAQSSGTSGGKSKYIPITSEGLRTNHYGGTRAAVAFYLNSNPASRLFSGRSFILGGSFANELKDLPDGVKVGDLSAHLIERIPRFAEIFRVPSRRTSLMSDWNAKLPRLVAEASKANVTNISGVPSWFLTVLKEILRTTGADNIHDVWPGLEVFFHGGIAFGPYREQYRAITDPSRMHYVETYNASEGFFAVQDDTEVRAMRLLVDIGVFYEFIAVDAVGESFPEALPAWKVEPGSTYALVITSANGLWRYLPGDTVRIESVEPLRITIAGRTSAFINAFGEELMVWNADAAIAAACAATGAAVANYTAGPVYATEASRGRHRWLIEWNTPPRGGNEAFAAILDRELQRVNSDYQAKRSGDIFLDRLELREVAAGTFDRWLAATGRLGGQRKVPRLSNTPALTDAILGFSGADS